MKAASTKLYAGVVKAPIAKTQDWMQKKKEQILDAPIPNVGPIPLGPTMNMTVRDGIDAAKDSMMQIVGKKDGGGEHKKDKEEAEFRYKNNPLDNPKVLKEVIENPKAVYGYSPKEISSLNKFKVDWTNAKEVADVRIERIIYHEKLKIEKERLSIEMEKLRGKGYSIEEIARIKVEQRNEGRINNYLKSGNQKGLEMMKQRNLDKYGNPDGPTPDQLYLKYGSWEEVVYASTRSNPGMDVLTGLYDIYGGD